MDFLVARVRHAQHRLPGADHLAGFDVDLRHHACGFGGQRGVARLVGSDAELRAGSGELGVGRLAGVDAGVERGLAEEFLRHQFLRAFQFNAGIAGVGLCRSQLRARFRRRQLRILRVEAGEHLAGFDHAAEFDQPLRDFAADAESQIGRAPRMHFA